MKNITEATSYFMHILLDNLQPKNSDLNLSQKEGNIYE